MKVIIIQVYKNLLNIYFLAGSDVGAGGDDDESKDVVDDDEDDEDEESRE